MSIRHDLDKLARWGGENLGAVVAIDSQSNEDSDTIPSSEGQRVLSDHLRRFFEGLGFAAEQDPFANLLVRVPATTKAQPLAFMVHMDTAEGTRAVPALEVTRGWDGAAIRYPANASLQVTPANYPSTREFVGEDVLHGRGDFPFGLDDKLGMAEVMTFAQLLGAEPRLPHGELLLVFRPDEEIGRMQAVEGLAETLARRGVRRGYTVDGIAPFEVNTENFNAARARVTFAAAPKQLVLAPGDRAVRLRLRLRGVNTHGATAKAEGYLNATVVFARALAGIDGVWPVDFRSDAALECNAEVELVLHGRNVGALEERVLAAFQREVEAHRWKGAAVERLAGAEVGPGELPTGVVRLARHLAAFLAEPGPEPRLSEQSDGHQGYSNPHFVTASATGWQLDYRLREFDPAKLSAREEHVRRLAKAGGDTVEVVQQYVNMGPALGRYPELVAWAQKAARGLGREAQVLPIRGGTGVDPFIKRDIAIANLGTGYFAPESEKELTSLQNLARHAAWLAELVQVVAA